MIHLPFHEQFKEPLLNGRKTMTCRTKQYGKPGSRFQAFGQLFQLHEIHPIVLWVVRARYWREEGCHSPEQFQQIWEDLHPRKGFDPSQRVYLHVFGKQSGGAGNPSLAEKSIARTEKHKAYLASLPVVSQQTCRHVWIVGGVAPWFDQYVCQHCGYVMECV